MTTSSGASRPVASQPAAENPKPYQPCTETCTTDCGRCKGRPLADLKRRTMRALWFGRDAHGGVPFDQKDAWKQGYDEARRKVMREFGLTGQEALR